MSISQGEKKIISILRAAGVDFEREKSFEEAVRVANCRFDFYLPEKNILFEYQGPQHYEYNSHFFKKKSDFTKAQERDRQKICASLAMNIPLYCIPYWELENIKSFEDLLNDKFLARNKFHNDDTWRTHQNLR